MAQLIGRIYVRSFTFVTEKRYHKRVAESEVYIYVGGRVMPGAIACRDAGKGREQERKLCRVDHVKSDRLLGYRPAEEGPGLP